jgi:predicted Zn-dependent peptidase
MKRGNDLPVIRVPIEGTRATTALIAFAAGARAESSRENGIAHFLEHLVFKGGTDYPTHREINEAGERIGARVDAWTSHEMVAFKVRSRAEVAADAIDLLTDFVGRPGLDPEELERERGVVIQEIARSKDRPEDRADELIDAAAFGDHPLGRPVLGTEERLRAFTREDVVAFRERRWCRQRGCVLLVGNLDHLPFDRELDRLFERFPAAPAPEPYAPPPATSSEVIVEAADSHHSHLRLLYRPDIDFGDRGVRAALTVFRTLLGGSQGSVLFEELRERRGLAYSTTALEAVSSDMAILQIDAGLESEQCPAAHDLIRGLVAKLAREGPDRDHVDRARSYAAGRRVLAFENSNVLADHLAQEAILHGEARRPEEEIAILDAVTYEEVAEVAGRIGDRPAVACVGPHTTADFS